MSGPLMIDREDPEGADARALVDELSGALERITGASGRASSDLATLRGEGACFAVARDAQGRAVGCGAYRELQPGVAEIKRMYARPGTRGVGRALLAFLEAQARSAGYAHAWLETRRVNAHAVGFYERHGYVPIENYGRYVGNDAAVCLGKALLA